MVRRETQSVDAERWPGLVAPRDVRNQSVADVADSLRGVARRLGVRIDYPDGHAVGEFDAPARLVLSDPQALWARLHQRGVRGFAESYMAGEWTTPDLVRVISVVAPWITDSGACATHGPRTDRGRRFRIGGLGVLQSSRAPVPDGVDLEDGLPGDLCSLYTDETMTTTGSVFASGARNRRFLPDGTEVVALEAPGRRPFRTDLGDSQRRSADMLLDLAGVERDGHVLVVPPGWGELPMRAAERGAHVRTVSSSPERLGVLGDRFDAAGLGERIELSDDTLRDVTGTFDSVITDEPAAATGLTGFADVLRAADTLVRPGGRLVAQVTVAPDRVAPVLHELAHWQREYVSDQAPVSGWHDLERIVDASRRFSVAGWVELTEHHAETARLWREKFSVRGRDAAAFGFDAVYRRMWTFHLAAIEARLRSGWVDTVQVLLRAR